jgi:TRAP transporter TAXI family solute receptor
MKRLLILGIIVLSIALASSSLAQKTVRLSIATGGTGAVFYPLGGGMANIISKYLPYAEATAEVTAASVDNCRLIGARKVELALTNIDSAVDAYRGVDVFKEKLPLRIVANIYQNFMHIVSAEGKGIAKLADLKGKRISLGAPGGATEVWGIRVLEAKRIDHKKDFRKERLGAGESAGALKDGKIDAYFFGGGIPVPSVMDLAATPGIKVKIVPHDEVIPILKEKYGPVYARGIIPAKSYPGQDIDVPVTIARVLFICHEKMDEKVVHDILKALFEHRQELMMVRKEAQYLTLDNQKAEFPLPFHPGAIRFYKDMGLEVK